MELFQPGAAYGRTFRNIIWVCVNVAPRSFEQCRPDESKAVWQALLSDVQRQGLGQSTVVFQSGCMMGCKAQGTTVAFAVAQEETPGHSLLFFHNVTVGDVPELIRAVLVRDDGD